MTWGFVWLMVILKIPLIGLLGLVWWAIRQQPEEAPAGEDDGGTKLRPRPHPHPRPRRPRSPRRDPHGALPPPAPPRVRSVVARARQAAH
jgi:hypothetical protein